MYFDHHVHMEHGPYTPENYPVDWIEQFFATAETRGVSGIGIVEHAYRFTQAEGLLPGSWSASRCHYNLSIYTEMWEALRDRFPVSLGLEMDYIPAQEDGIRRFLEQYPWDFVIGSVHFIDDFGLDVKDMAAQYDVLGPDEVWTRYYRASIQAVQSKMFHVISHPDLPKIWGHPKPDQKVMRSLYQEFVQALKTHQVALEINSAGLRRPVQEIYPHPDLLHLAYEAGVPVTLASDAHEPENVGAFFPEAAQLALAAGYKTALSFKNRQGAPYTLNRT